MIRNLFGGSKCRTIDVCDIFGDGSGKALYRLDGNANDESGNYHGTEANITYGGGVYERGAVFTSANSSKISMPNTPLDTNYSISWWVKSSGTRAVHVMFSVLPSGHAFYYRTDNNTIEITTNYLYTCPSNTTGEYYDGNWHLLTLVFNGTTTKFYKDTVEVVLTQGIASTKPTAITILGAYTSAGYFFNGSIDQVRIFNRALTATEVATLYVECAPTSTVDNINPFEDGSLKALYQFNGDATDKTGVYNGTATNVTYGTGKFGQCAVFNGSTSLVDTGATLATFGVANFSMSCWSYNTSYSTTEGIIGSSTTNGFAFGITTSGYIQVNWDGANQLQQTSGTSATVNAWHHICITYSGGTLRGYVDGNLVITNTGRSNCVTLGNLKIGYGASAYWSGNIDQTRIFNKALTPMEVASLYNETTPMEEPMHSLVDPFKDGSGKALYRLDGNALDESGNYNGTATSVTYGNATVGREAIFNGSASITATLALSSNTFSYSVWATVTTVSSTIQSLIDFSTGRAMLCSGNGTNAYLSYYDGTAYRVFGTYALTSATRTHIGLAVNGTSVELFINGVSQGTSACNAVTPSGTIALGKYAGSASGYLTGRENQTRIFNRVLTASEFLQLYNQGA